MVSRNTTPFFDFIIFERYTSKQFNQEQGLALFPLTTVPIYIVSVPKILISTSCLYYNAFSIFRPYIVTVL